MDNFYYFLNIKILNNSLQNIILALFAFLVVHLLIFIFKKYIAIKISSFVKKTVTKIDDIAFEALYKLVNLGGSLLAFFIALEFIVLPDVISIIFHKIIIIIATIIVTWILQELIINIIDESFKRISATLKRSFIPFFKNILNIFIWIIAGIFILSNLGYKITSLTAGLGIGGLAIALAVKPTLEAFFASVAIFSERHFQIGDIINVGGLSGTVKHIGLRTSVIETFSGTDLIIPNIELTSQTIENITKRAGERIDASVGVVYNTSSEKLKKGMSIIKSILEKNKSINEDIRVWFNSFGDSALIIKFTYFIDATLPYIERLNIISEVNIFIKRGFEKEKLEMAYPTQTLFVKNLK